MGADQSIEVRAAGGDRAAFTALMTATKADLYRFVRRYVGDFELKVTVTNLV